jgi:hypothetical protein
MINRHKQKGAETVEFAMIALLFFAFLFAIIEFSRAMFVWNALSEATRRGARMAVVCPVESDVPKQVALFGDIFDDKAGTLTTSPIISGLTPDMVKIRYLDESHGEVTDPAKKTDIRFAEVIISGYEHMLLIPLWGRPLTAPEFKTTLPTESLGAVPTYPGETVKDPDCVF